MERIYFISGFYKSDKPGGFGFQIKDVAPEMLNIIVELADEIATDGTTDDEIIDELDSYAKRKGGLDTADMASAIALVIAAERKRLIPSNNYNGYLQGSLRGRVLAKGAVMSVSYYTTLPVPASRQA